MASEPFDSSHHGQIVRYYRKRKKWSRSKLAQELGVDESTIYRMERRPTLRDPQRRQILIALLGIPASLMEVTEELPLSKEVFPVFNNDSMAFFEDQVGTRWDMYRTGGTLYASQGLKSFIQEIEHFAQKAQGTMWQARANALVCLTYQLQAGISSDLLQYEQAQQAYTKAFRVAEEANDSELLASALARQGVTFIQQNQPVEASTCLNAALETVHGRGFVSLRGYILKALSEAYALARQESPSVRAIEQAERTLEYTSGVLERSHCYINKASVLAQKGINAGLLQDHERAIVLIDKSLLTYSPTIVRGRARLLAQKAQAYYGLNDLWECITMAEEAYKLADAVGSAKTLARLRSLQQTLLHSRWGKEASVIRLGMLLAR